MITQDNLLTLQKKFKQHDFTGGECHNLALALYKANNGIGKLLAGIRSYEDPEEGPIQVYSHMVYELNGETYDIGGKEAVARWEAMWEYPDENGIESYINWEEVDPKNAAKFVEEWEGTRPVDKILISRIVTYVKLTSSLTSCIS